jgi:hypothetical protein
VKNLELFPAFFQVPTPQHGEGDSSGKGVYLGWNHCIHTDEGNLIESQPHGECGLLLQTLIKHTILVIISWRYIALAAATLGSTELPLISIELHSIGH